MSEAEERTLQRLGEPGSAAPPTAPYEPLLGAWNVVWRKFDAEGQPNEGVRGEWHFTRVLGGYGVQDVIWPVGEPPEAAGTTLRCWDPRIQTWRAVFMSPRDGEFVSLVGYPTPDGIRQQVVDPVEPGTQREWNFSQIEPRAFLWQARQSDDGGSTWRITHEIRAQR